MLEYDPYSSGALAVSYTHLDVYKRQELSYGYSVELEGLGHFSPSVKSKEVTDQKGNTKSSASIHGVNFRCSPRLKEMVKKNAPILVKRENLPKTGIEGRKAKMLSYLERNSYINLKMCIRDSLHTMPVIRLEDQNGIIRQPLGCQEST